MTREVLGDSASFVGVGDVDALAGALAAAVDEDGGTTTASAARRDRARLLHLGPVCEDDTRCLRRRPRGRG